MKTCVYPLGKDKLGLDWHVMVKDYPMGKLRFLDFIPFIRTGTLSETRVKKVLKPTEVACVHPRSRTQAYLNDIQVGDVYQDRGLGTLLIRFVEEWEKERGINEIFGDISIKDRNDFSKLEHFYIKNGWTFELFDNWQSIQGTTTVGRVCKKLK
jgi:GNAT superfamily N-acetyltransferase